MVALERADKRFMALPSQFSLFQQSVQYFRTLRVFLLKGKTDFSSDEFRINMFYLKTEESGWVFGLVV